jgi:hypothetical protein
LHIEPANRRGLFVARVAADFRFLCKSRQPFVDSARVLLQEGIDPETILISRLAGQDHNSLRSKVGLAAKVTVDEHNGTVFAKYKPLSHSAVPLRKRSAPAMATAVAPEVVEVAQRLPKDFRSLSEANPNDEA